jgi:hypothetical protein
MEWKVRRNGIGVAFYDCYLWYGSCAYAIDVDGKREELVRMLASTYRGTIEVKVEVRPGGSVKRGSVKYTRESEQSVCQIMLK